MDFNISLAILFILASLVTQIASEEFCDNELLDAKIKNITDIISSIKNVILRRKKSVSRFPVSSKIAEKIYYIPLGKIKLKKFMIDMAVDMKYSRSKKHSRNPGNLKAVADVNAKLFDNKEMTNSFSNPVNKYSGKGHFEYLSPLLKLSLGSLPVGVQLFIPIQKSMNEWKP